jgi:hypothetical protein
MMISAIIAPSVILAFSLNVVRLSIFASKALTRPYFSVRQPPSRKYLTRPSMGTGLFVHLGRIPPQCFMSSLIATPMIRKCRQVIACRLRYDW